MTAIPNDVLEAALNAGNVALRNLDQDDLSVEVGAIARAILAERRRCALLARQWQESSFKDEVFAANSIADQIMAGAK